MRRKYPFSFHEIAALAGVSAATVSRVMNDQSTVRKDLVDRVYSALVQKGVNPNDYILKPPSSGHLLLFILPFDFNSFFNEIIKGAKASAIQHGYTMMILQEHINSNTFPTLEHLIKNSKISGVICLNHVSSQLMHALTSLVPVVQCCDYDSQSKSVSSVSLDDFNMAMAAVNHLLSHGRKRIAFMSGSLKYQDNFTRQEGYLRALEAAHIRPNSRWIINLPEINYSMAFSTATQLLSQPGRPDAFLAISVSLRLRHHQRRTLPETASAGRSDGHWLRQCRLCHDLLSLHHHRQHAENIRWAIPRVNCSSTGSENPNASTQHIDLQLELIIRDSTTIRPGTEQVPKGI